MQWIHTIAKANNIMYPDYKDKSLKLTKLFLNILILGNETTKQDKLFQIATACEKRNSKSLCESVVVGL